MEQEFLGNRYRVIRQLGSGGFSRTFLVTDIHLPNHPQCVIKQLRMQDKNIIPLEFGTKDSDTKNTDLLDMARRLFDTEARVLYQLGNHPQIPSLLAHFEEDREFYMAVEYIEGSRLNNQIKDGKPWPESRVASLLTEVLEILSFVHQNQVIHRDVKPSNLIRRHSDKKLVLIDFGAVKQVMASPLLQPETGTTEITVAIGTHGYMPNEQYAGKPRFSSDVYAVGIIGIRALTGIHPQALEEDPITSELDWRKHAPSVSPALADVLDIMVRYDFRDRYPNAQKALEAIQNLPNSPSDRIVSGLNSTEYESKSRVKQDFYLDDSSKVIPCEINLKITTELILVGGSFQITVEVHSGRSDHMDGFHFDMSKEDCLNRELIFLLASSDFQINSQNGASIPFSPAFLLGDKENLIFHLTALKSGDSNLFLEIYLNDDFKGRIQKNIFVSDFDENGSYAKTEVTRSRPVLSPELTLKTQGVCGSNLDFHLICQLTNLATPHSLNGLLSSSKSFQFDLTGKFRRELSLTAEKAYAVASQPKEQLAAMSSLGQTLFRCLLPQDIQDELRSVRHFPRPASLMILADQTTWLPWEIMHDGQHFLGEQFILGRWPLEISDKRPYEFAIGSVKLAHYANVERPEMWLDLLESLGSMPPSVMQQGIFEDLGLAEVLQGLHLVRQGESDNDLDDRIDAPVAIQEAHSAEGVEEQLRPGKLNLRRNRPVVSLGYLQNGHKELTNIETAWVPAFLRAGCSAFVGSLWSVRPEVEAAFISNFYSNLWAGNNLGLAFYKAKQMARVAVPESVDWLAYVLYGDPMARPYRPVEGRGYAVVEAVGHDLDQPVASGSTLRLRASLRRKPPIWYENRLMDVTEALNFADLKVYIAASGIEVKPSDCIEMRRIPDGDYLGWFNLSIPSELAGHTILVQVHFEDGNDPIQSQRLTLKVAEA